MKYFIKKFQIIFLSFLLLVNYACDFSVETQRPNIIYILADDLGYGEVGAFGQKVIETPNIDNLAKSGMIFTESLFWSSCLCSCKKRFVNWKTFWKYSHKS